MVELRLRLVFAPPQGLGENQRMLYRFLPHQPPQQMPDLRHAQGNEHVLAGPLLFLGVFPRACARTTVR